MSKSRLCVKPELGTLYCGRMRIIAPRSYPHGYRGFVEEKDRYVFFVFPRKGKWKDSMEYKKEEFVLKKRSVDKKRSASSGLKTSLPIQTCWMGRSLRVRHAGQTENRGWGAGGNPEIIYLDLLFDDE